MQLFPLHNFSGCMADLFNQRTAALCGVATPGWRLHIAARPV
jgi:hypothetical protein